MELASDIRRYDNFSARIVVLGHLDFQRALRNGDAASAAFYPNFRQEILVAKTVKHQYGLLGRVKFLATMGHRKAGSFCFPVANGQGVGCLFDGLQTILAGRKNLLADHEIERDIAANVDGLRLSAGNGQQQAHCHDRET